MVQWLSFRASIPGGMGSIPGGGTKIQHAKRIKKIKILKDKVCSSMKLVCSQNSATNGHSLSLEKCISPQQKPID